MRARSAKVGGCARDPMLAVWGLAGLHRGSAEYSAQGLARTVSVAVETAWLNGQRLVLGESGGWDEGGGHEGVGGAGGPWTERVPLLSGSVRFGGEDRVWAGRTVEVGRVVGKWCRFVTVGEGG